MNILIVGSGSYVLSDMYGPGVVLRSVLQWLHKMQTQKQRVTDAIESQKASVKITYHNPETLAGKQLKVVAIMQSMQIPAELISVEFFPDQKVASLIEAGNIHACFVAVPDQYHRIYSEMCMQRAVPLWLVKPLCGNWVDTQALVALQSQTAAKVWVDYHKRFDASNAWLKIKANSGEMGRLLSYSVDYHQPRVLPIDVFSWAKDVDVFTYIGCHYVDQVFYLYPEARLVSVEAEPLKGIVFKETGQFDGVLATIKFNTAMGPLMCPMNVGWFNPSGAPTKSLQTIKAQFENGLVSLDQTRRGINVWSDEGVSEINPYFFGETLNLHGSIEFSGYGYDSVRQFLDCTIGDETWPENGCIPSLEESAKTEYVLHGVQQALKTGHKFIVS